MYKIVLISDGLDIEPQGTIVDTYESNFMPENGDTIIFGKKYFYVNSRYYFVEEKEIIYCHGTVLENEVSFIRVHDKL